MDQTEQLVGEQDRRNFVKSMATAMGSGYALNAFGESALANDAAPVRVGLVGCGGRGMGAVVNMFRASKSVKLWALADTFKDKVDRADSRFKTQYPTQYAVKARKFAGFDAYKSLLSSGVDVVILATPCHFRPAHIRAAVDAGKHIFAEKPVAVDVQGAKSVLDSCKRAQSKNLSVVSGLCWRYHLGVRETIKQIHDGRIGKILALECAFNKGQQGSQKRESSWSEMEYQIRNWDHHNWLSGDVTGEMLVHHLDVASWIMKQYPESASGFGGRTPNKIGNIFASHAIRFVYQGGIPLNAYCRHVDRTKSDYFVHVYGTKGRANIFKHRIEGDSPWRYGKRAPNMYDYEMKALVGSIQNKKPINNGTYMVKSTLMSIMGRWATYTGKQIGWNQNLGSQQYLGPKTYKWGNLKLDPVAQPGITSFV